MLSSRNTIRSQTNSLLLYIVLVISALLLILCSNHAEAVIDGMCPVQYQDAKWAHKRAKLGIWDICALVYVNSNTGSDTLPDDSFNFGTDDQLPAKTLQRVLGKWKDETYVTIHVAAGTYKLNQLSFTKTEDFELKWTSPPPTLFGTYPAENEPYEEPQ